MNWIRLINSTSIFRILLKRLRYLLQLANIISFFLTLLPPVVVPTIPLYRNLPYTTKNQSDNMNI